MTSTTCATNATTTSSVTPVMSAGKGNLPCIDEYYSNPSEYWSNVSTFWPKVSKYWSNPADSLFNLGNPAFDISSLENRCQFPLCGLPTEVIQHIFMQCLTSGDGKGCMALGLTNVHSLITMGKLINETALTQLCPNLRILDAKTFTFHADLENVDKYKTVQSYYQLEPFVERREGLTIIFNHDGLTLKDMKENKCEVTVHIWTPRISEELDNIPEVDTGPEMVSNAPITETRNKTHAAQDTRVIDEVGFDDKPTLIQYLALIIATQNKLKMCLYGDKPLTYGSSSTQWSIFSLSVGAAFSGCLTVDTSSLNIWGNQKEGAGGRRKLWVTGPGTFGGRKLVSS